MNCQRVRFALRSLQSTFGSSQFLVSEGAGQYAAAVMQWQPCARTSELKASAAHIPAFHLLPVEATRSFKTAFPSLAPSSGDDSSGDDSSSSSDNDDDLDDLEDLVDDDSDSEDEGEHWQQYRELREGEADEDADSVDAQVPQSRFALPDPARKAGLDALEHSESQEAEQNADSKEDTPALTQSEPRQQPDEEEQTLPIDGSVPLRDLYEAQLDDYARKMTGLHSNRRTASGRKLSRAELAKTLAEATARDDMQVQDLPDIPSQVVEPGLQQLEVLTADGEWMMSIVDVKMTTTQTPQGKKSRYSSMVMVGNLKGKGAYGIGVAKEANDSIFKALRYAILGAINIPLYRGHTVYYPSKTKFIRTKISIFPRPSDFGISASPIITEACELLGIRDITVKTHNSRNIRNVVKGFFQALANIPTAAEVAQAKGIYVKERLSNRLYHKDHLHT